MTQDRGPGRWKLKPRHDAAETLGPRRCPWCRSTGKMLKRWLRQSSRGAIGTKANLKQTFAAPLPRTRKTSKGIQRP
jgi:hypothetical protein